MGVAGKIEMPKKVRIFFLFIVLGSAFHFLAARDCLARSGPHAKEILAAGEKFYSEGNWAAAKENFRVFLSDQPLPDGTDGALLRLAEISLKEEDPVVASRYLDILLAQFQDSEWIGPAKYKKALCRYQLGDNDAALALLAESLKESPDPSLKYEAYVLTAKCLLARGDLAGAVENFGKAGSVFPDKRKETDSLIRDALEKETRAQALLAFSQAGSDPFPHGEALSRLLSLYLRQGNHVKFAETASLFLQRFPGREEARQIAQTLAALQSSPGGLKTKIGVLLPLTGNAALQGEKVLKGIQLAYSLFPSPDEVELLIKDSEGDPQKARAAMEEFASDPSVAAILGPVLSKEAEDLIPLSEAAGILMLSPAASSLELPSGGKFFFRNCITNEIQGRGMAEFAVNHLGLKRFVVISPDDAYGKELKGFFEKNIRAMGREVVAAEEYAEKDVDFSALIKKIGGMEDEDMAKEALASAKRAEESGPSVNDPERLTLPRVEGGPWVAYDPKQHQASLEVHYDAIFIPGFFEKIGLIVPQLEFFNIEGVKLLGSSGWNTPHIVDLAKGHSERLFFMDGFFPGTKIEKAREFVELHKSFFGETPGVLAAQAYDAAQIVLGLYQSGKRDRKSMRDGLSETRDFPGVSGTTTMLSTGGAEKEMFFMTVKKNKIEEIERR